MGALLRLPSPIAVGLGLYVLGQMLLAAIALNPYFGPVYGHRPPQPLGVG